MTVLASRSSWPVIVGGCHRSGTSLIRRILDAHTRIHCGPEVKFFKDFHGAYLNDPLAHGRFMTSARAILPESDLLDILGSAFVMMHERAAALAGKVRWADKAPENVLYWPHWQRLLGDEWVLVHVVRHPLDTLASIDEVGFRSLPAALDDRIALYASYIQGGLRFAATHPDRYVRVIYEQLVTEPRQVIADLMTQIGEEHEAGQLEFNSKPHQRGLEDPKVASTRTVHDRSVGRWRTALSEREREQITEACEPLWREIDPTGRFARIALDADREARPL